MRRVLIPFVVLAVALGFAGPAVAAPHTFDGSCQVLGTVSFDSYQSETYTFAGEGTCTGLLDGQLVQDTPIAVDSSGSVRGFVVPLLGFGAGSLEFTDTAVSFPIAIQQLGTLLRVYPACMGCSGAAAGPLESFTPTQPPPEPDGPRTNIRIVTQTIRTFTTP